VECLSIHYAKSISQSNTTSKSGAFLPKIDLTQDIILFI